MSRAISCVSLIFCTWAWPPLPGAIKEGLTEQVMSAWRSTEKEEPGEKLPGWWENKHKNQEVGEDWIC